ncbi:WD40 repeat [Trinorchestia longiramus]|nr:WD40 repeat [Trinorchestia longiramus]
MLPCRWLGWFFFIHYYLQLRIPETNVASPVSSTHSTLEDYSSSDSEQGSDHSEPEITPRQLIASLMRMERSPRRREENEEEVVVEDDGNWLSSDSDEEEKRATLEEVFEIEPSIECVRDQPPDLNVGSEVIDVEFHPSEHLLVVANFDREIICYKCSKEKTEEVGNTHHHSDSLRCIKFTKDGSVLFTGSKDLSVAAIDTTTWRVKKQFFKAHRSPVYSVCAIDENTFASGDDDGTVKLWDIRRAKAVFKFKCGEETVNSMITDDNGRTLVAALDDGSLAAFNTSRRKLIVQSEMYDTSLSCLAVVRNGTRLAVGSDIGSLFLFKWGEFALHYDKVAEQHSKLNCLVPVGDGRLVSGSDDGYIRAINLYPHNYAGVVGRNSKYGIENISVSCDQRYLASCSNDEVVQFWDLQHLYQTKKRKKSCLARDLKNNLGSARERNPTQFFADMSEEVHSDEEYRGPAQRPRNVE